MLEVWYTREKKEQRKGEKRRTCRCVRTAVSHVDDYAKARHRGLEADRRMR